jgi:KTSC domain
MLVVVAVESSTIASVGYDLPQRLLQLEFCGRTIYHYFGVPASIYRALLDAPSKGNYFNRAIRGCFPYRRVVAVPASAPDGESMPGAVGR